VAVVCGAVLLAACSSGPGSPSAHGGSPSHRHTGTGTGSTTTSTTLAPPSRSGPLQAGAPIGLPFSADRVTASESPDGAVFAAPQDPTSTSPAIAWVVDGNGPAAVAEHVPTGIAALAADATNFYVATYSNVFAYNRTTGNQDGQWNMPPVSAANGSDDDLVAMAAADGAVFVSVTKGSAVTVYLLNPGSATGPRLLLHTLGAVVGSDGSVYYVSSDHHLAVRRPNGTTATGPALADQPNGLGGGVQYLDTVAGGAVWVSQPAGQGLDAGYTTYDVTTLAVIASYSGSVTNTVTDTAAGPLVLQPASGTPTGCPQSPSPGGCVLRIDTHGTISEPLAVGAAVSLIGPSPAVIESDTTTGQFDLVRLS
jgi:hypothetical protein